jgi:hypothetical protein
LRPLISLANESAWKLRSATQERAAKKVVIDEGAESIRNRADLHFLGAIQIVDLYHPWQYLWDLARRSPPRIPSKQKARMNKHQPQRDEGKIE